MHGNSISRQCDIKNATNILHFSIVLCSCFETVFRAGLPGVTDAVNQRSVHAVKYELELRLM